MYFCDAYKHLTFSDIKIKIKKLKKKKKNSHNLLAQSIQKRKKYVKFECKEKILYTLNICKKLEFGSLLHTFLN